MRPAIPMLLLVALLGTPAQAEDYRLSGFALDLVSGSYATETRPIDGLAVTDIAAGQVPLTLEDTPIAELAVVLGGDVHEASPFLSWACYALTGGGTFWALSEGDGAGGRITAAALELRDAPAEAGCAATALKAANIRFGVAPLGTSARDLAETSGAFDIDQGGRVGFHAERPAWGEVEFATSQWLVYRLRAGRVDAIGITQATDNTPLEPPAE